MIRDFINEKDDEIICKVGGMLHSNKHKSKIYISTSDLRVVLEALGMDCDKVPGSDGWW